MPVITVRTVLAANGGPVFPLQGSQYEFMPYDGIVEFALLTDATGVLETIQSGTDILEQEGPVALGTINVKPVYPDNYQLRDVAGAGERISISIRDTSGAQRIVMSQVKITPLG